MTTHLMNDNSHLTTAEIEAKIRDAENAVKTLERIEKIVGRLGVDYHAVQLNLADLRREWNVSESEKKMNRMQLAGMVG